MENIDEVFSYALACDINNGNEDPEPRSIVERQNRHDWLKWKDAIQAELNSLNKRKVFGPIVLMPKAIKPVGYKWHLQNGIFVHQSIYTKKVLKRFNMDKVNPLSTPMVVRSLNVENDPFRPCEDNEEIVGPEVPYLSAIGALMYLANCTRPDIAFAVNLLARFSSSPTRRHWNGIKHIFRYLQGTIDLGLFYPNESKKGLIGYADAGHLSDPHKARSQTGYVFTCGGTAISWRLQK
ncbi:hypothetical protein UlMin_020379 [Ulmus minor]